MGSNSRNIVSAMTWRNILLLLFYLAITGVYSDNCAYSGNCNADVKRLLAIRCDKDNFDAKCTCEGSAENSTFNTATCDTINTILTEENTFNKMDAGACEKLCRDDGVDKCSFFKLVEENRYLGGDKVCYLMDENQCNAESETTCDSSHCSSGGIDCDGTDPTTTTPAPANVNCKTAPLLTHNDDGEHLRWRCTDSQQVYFNIYDTKYYADTGSENVPAGTVCQATNKCKDYADPPGTVTPEANFYLSYKCAASADDPTQWIWQTNRNDDNNYDNDALEDFGDPNSVKVLKEAECKADPLVLNKESYNQDGLLISCTDSQVYYKDGKPEVSAPNTCMMTCDFFDVITFYPGRRNPDTMGERVWLFEMENGLTVNDGNADISDGEIDTVDPDGLLSPKNLLSCW